MRHIQLDSKRPSRRWLTRAKNALDLLKTAQNSEDRKAMIDAHSSVWSDLKQWLLSLSDGKCWFSEAEDIFSYLHVEHYRPKKTAKDEDGTQHDGYWWLTFDWQNFRICGSVGNTSKGTFFPLRPGCARIQNVSGDLRLEDPKLLDPTDDSDPNLLSFDQEGKAKVAPGVIGWNKERVDYSIKRLKLDFPPLEEKRKVIWSECFNRIKKYEEELSKWEDTGSPIARQMSKEHAKAIRKMIQPGQELSSVARACILSTGNSSITRLLQSS